MQEDINKKIDRVLNDMRAPFPSKDASWDRLINRIDSLEPAKNKKSLRYAYLATAASIALVIGLLFFMNQGPKRISTGLAHHKTIELPDGSVVELNASSYIEYDEMEFKVDRKLTLDGEAFFRVKKGSSFDVITKQGAISVLGTSFNVYDRENYFEVACETGKVSVSHDTDKIILSPGLATNNKSGKLAPAYGIKNAGDWIRGSFNFEEESLSSVFDEIERQFGVNVECNVLEGRYFTGEFDSTDLETAMEVICQPMGLDYQLKEDLEIVVTSK